jgi:hypothetical protein
LIGEYYRLPSSFYFYSKQLILKDKNFKKIQDILDKHKFSEEEKKKLWNQTIKEIIISKKTNYNLSPKPERKDNKNRLNGSGGSNCNKIRFPKKKRKTAWKRFFKLFPKLKEKNNATIYST